MKNTVILFLLLLLTGCVQSQFERTTQPNSTSQPSATSSSSETTANAGKHHPVKLKLNDPDFLQLAANGKLKGMAIQLNSSKDEVLMHWGNPKEQGVGNAEYWGYSTCYFYFSNQRNVSAIRLMNEDKQLTTTKLIQLLGNPYSEGKDEESDAYSLNYRTGNNEIYFDAVSKKGVVLDILFKSQ